MELAAFKAEIEKKHEEEIKKRMNDPPCALPGTYEGRIGTAVPPGWQPRDPPVDAVCPEDEDAKWKRATNLPMPECLCRRRRTVPQNINL